MVWSVCAGLAGCSARHAAGVSSEKLTANSAAAGSSVNGAGGSSDHVASSAGRTQLVLLVSSIPSDSLLAIERIGAWKKRIPRLTSSAGEHDEGAYLG